MKNLLEALPTVFTAALAVFAIYKDYKHPTARKEMLGLNRPGLIMLALVVLGTVISLWIFNRQQDQSTNLEADLKSSKKETAITREQLNQALAETVITRKQLDRSLAEGAEMGKNVKEVLKLILQVEGVVPIKEGDFLANSRYHTKNRDSLEPSYETLDLEAIARDYVKLNAESKATN